MKKQSNRSDFIIVIRTVDSLGNDENDVEVKNQPLISCISRDINEKPIVVGYTHVKNSLHS